MTFGVWELELPGAPWIGLPTEPFLRRPSPGTAGLGPVTGPFAMCCWSPNCDYHQVAMIGCRPWCARRPPPPQRQENRGDTRVHQPQTFRVIGLFGWAHYSGWAPSIPKLEPREQLQLPWRGIGDRRARTPVGN